MWMLPYYNLYSSELSELCLFALNGWCSWICEEASYQEKRLALAERGRNERF